MKKNILLSLNKEEITNIDEMIELAGEDFKIDIVNYINLKNSNIFSLKLSAFELNTKSLFVKYANNTAKIIAIALDIFSSNL